MRAPFSLREEADASSPEPPREPQRGEHSRPPSPVSRPRLQVVDCGHMPYTAALELQRAVARARISGAIAEDVLLLVEHPHVVTVGRSARGGTLTAPLALLEARGAALFEVDRGGDVTYHGPGQLVGYPIVDLKRHKQDLHWYLRQVEEALIVALRAHGLDGWRSPGYTGVWVGAEGVGAGIGKIASIGVHARDWVTWHGFALNVSTDLSFFELMIPCGIDGVRMTSIAQEWRAGGRSESEPSPTLGEVSRGVAAAFASVFGLEATSGSLDDLRLEGADARGAPAAPPASA